MAGSSNKSSQTANSMDPDHKSLCLSVVAMPPEDDLPELAVNRQWREEVRRVRKEMGLSQDELGKMVDSDQTQISRLETGDIGSSTLVMPICRALGIDPPEHFLDDEARLWNRRFEIMRSSDSKAAQAMLAAFKEMADELAEVQAEQRRNAEPVTSEKPKKST
jgi:transcriptional regulator with XRE-family HTH domain